MTFLGRRGALGLGMRFGMGLGMGLGIAATMAPTLSARAATAGCGRLAPLKWAPRTRRVMENLIAAHGSASPAYDPARPPYAVFDWDNTCITGDCEETLLHYTASRFLFAMPVETFAQATARDVPHRTFSAFRTVDGHDVRFADLHADLCADYATLATRGGTPAPDDPALLSLRSKLVYAYDAISATCDGEVACRWIIRLLAGYDATGLAALARASNTWHLGQAIRRETWITPATRPGRAGIIARPVRMGLRLSPEIADLQSVLRAAGIEVYVCSASLEEVVAVFATDPDYGYDLPRANVLGVRMQWPDGRLGLGAAPHWPVTYHAGKVRAIRQALARRHGRGPLLVCGDSSGDYDMLTAFPDTRLGLIINRLSSGPIGTLAARAVAQMSSDQPRFVLQGRDGNTGEWRPSEQTIPLGHDVAQLSGPVRAT
ncbi:haloacid dehalogenase-like hydrolase [Novacetimonas pomaceti]|uniref:haloacid dehalogenase-like hydrolase n=1 Tax=Novacetimonas pomaceti TaxID=2021998 RepID=UPI001C2DE3A1|nr:haloacid dehalogenase-like hydrolase [Novacetimonas pomaceti]MBV1834484.1 haloacid dehalogenase-like hydrolase [Novacetimonas pomaceti]